jgi:hypothetical protein
MHLPGAGRDQARELARSGPHQLDPVQAQHVGGCVDVVDHVVERAQEREDVLAVDRRDEGAVQPLERVVHDLIAAVLDVLDRRRLLGERAVGREHLLEQGGALAQLVRDRGEVLEELLLARDQSKAEPRHRSSILR